MRQSGKLLCAIGLIMTMGMLTGCSPSSAITVGKMGLNLVKSGSKLKVMLDGEKGKQNPLKKAWKGPKGARYVVKEPVSTSPVFRYILKDPDKFGRIATVVLAIHQEFEGDFSHLAEFIVHGKDNTAESQLKPDTDYNLASLHENFKILNHRGDPVDQVKLIPGLQYRLVLTVAADRS
ncbi:MAG: hypothetical protein ACYTF1_18910, partial [Planctomycetota bacterium]